MFTQAQLKTQIELSFSFQGRKILQIRISAKVLGCTVLNVKECYYYFKVGSLVFD